MSYSKNDMRVQDGGIGLTQGFANNAIAVIGISEKTPQGVVTLGSISEIEEKLGEGPLRDFLVDAFSFERQPLAYVKAIQGSIAGTKSTVTKSGTGVGSIALSGDPRNEYRVLIEILSSGGLNEATFQATIDNRVIVKSTVPALPGTFLLGNTGITLTFDDGNPQVGETAFVEGDTFSFTTTQPQATNEELLNAIDEIIGINKKFRILAVAMVTSKVFWSAFNSRLESLTSKNFFCRGLTIARDKANDETIDQYITKLTDPNQERGNFDAKRIAVVCSYNEIVDFVNANSDTRSIAGKYLGFLMQNKIYESPAKTLLGEISGIMSRKSYSESGNDTKLSEANIIALDSAGFVTTREYFEQPGIYFTSGRMLCKESSDYAEIMNCSVMDKACSLVAEKLFYYFNKDEDIGTDGTITGLTYIKSYGQKPINDMKTIYQEISQGEFIVPKNQDLLKTKNLNYFVEIVPKGYITTLTGTLKFTNPYVTK